MVRKFILVPRLKIQNANALSSPYTIGFPAMTAWLGGVHSLERRLQDTGFSAVQLPSMAVVCHDLDLQTYKGDGDYVHSVIGTGNPLIPKPQKDNPHNAERPPFVEEARCHLTVSLLIEYANVGLQAEAMSRQVDHLLQGAMKMAGGDIMAVEPSCLVVVRDGEERRTLLRQLMPGYCLLERRDLMKQGMAQGLDGIDALLEYLKITHSCEVDGHQKVKWTSGRKERGWLVPISVGYQGISPLGHAINQRAYDAEHRFAESVVTLGEFVMPHRIDDLESILWQYQPNLETDLYLCKTIKPVINSNQHPRITHGQK